MRETNFALQSQKTQARQGRFAYLWYWDFQGGFNNQVLYLTEGIEFGPRLSNKLISRITPNVR
jgi:hypothetical protein